MTASISSMCTKNSPSASEQSETAGCMNLKRVYVSFVLHKIRRIVLRIHNFFNTLKKTVNQRNFLNEN